jgi:hypothetical protein
MLGLLIRPGAATLGREELEKSFGYRTRISGILAFRSGIELIRMRAGAAAEILTATAARQGHVKE